MRFGQAYQDELQAWVTALAAGATVAPGASDAWDGYAAIAVAETAVASFARHARTEVQLVDRPGALRPGGSGHEDRARPLDDP